MTDMDENNNGIVDDSKITSTDFDYDIYSGGSAMEYLKQENERKKREREDAGKSEGMRKREEYERRFAGMSADEIFNDAPKKKKKPEDDFSDFFDADEIERQQEKVRKFEEDVRRAKAAQQAEQAQSGEGTLPQPEGMMPGEEEPSSQPRGMTREDAMEAAAVMMAHRTFEREREERRYHNMRRSRYRRSMFEGLFFEWLLDSLNAGDKTKRSIARVIYYIAWFFLGALIYGVYSYARFRKLTPYAVIWGAVGGLAGGFIQRFFREEDTFLKALVNCIVEFVLLAIAVVLVLVVKVK